MNQPNQPQPVLLAAEPVSFVVFLDKEGVAHMAAATACHITFMRDCQTIMVGNRAYEVSGDVSFNPLQQSLHLYNQLANVIRTKAQNDGGTPT